MTLVRRKGAGSAGQSCASSRKLSSASGRPVGIGGARGDVAPERGHVVDRAGRAQRRKVDEIVEQEAARRPGR